MPTQKLWSNFIVSYYKNLELRPSLPGSVKWLYPQDDVRVLEIVSAFAEKFYCDGQTRQLMLGINPGRFGAGVTGVNFTAPRQLKENCGIDHPFKDHSELSAEFIYEMITAYGGVSKFYSRFFIGSVCPLGLVSEGRNLNYYDDKKVLQLLEPFIVNNIEQLAAYKVDRDLCFSIGGEKNYKYLQTLNKKFGWFREIQPLPHPRFIMQYRRKQVPHFIRHYIDALKKQSVRI